MPMMQKGKDEEDAFNPHPTTQVFNIIQQNLPFIMLLLTRITRPSTRIKVSMVTSVGRATFRSAIKMNRPVPSAQDVGRGM
ncbi:hypothetical protein I314_03633 [Cryptococcus bacillisporus CA1873]|uniref:Uncharacterized protein n=1 Tax=Cryptococcus bacillisporus CA1873 TaxID=1296111 RepID=A0ABR5B9S0_CRYGA|nr:hypothetical protein I314_03633 [Cryptococcus bacillisporus CA1873]|eukprot:KIR60342.1 hypothetical protein I314_03633 [Cryptococcus gattii CA1873]